MKNALLTAVLLTISTFVASAANRVYSVGPNVKAPVVIERPSIDYSFCKLTGKRISGAPIGEVVISAKGRVERVSLVKGVEPCLDRAFVDNLKSWRFRPGTLNGKPVRVRANFTLLIHYR